MKALQVEEYGGPEKLILREIADPVPGPGEILVEIRAAGVNPVDTYWRSGTRGYNPQLPFTPGLDGAGTILACGEGCKSFRPGNKVYTFGSLSGTYAELCLCKESQVFHLPSGLEWNQGARLGMPYFTAARALFSSVGVMDKDTVLVHGASGSVGLAALQILSGSHTKILGSAGSEEGREFVLQNGATHCFNHLADEHYREIMELTHNRGVDFIIEMSAGKNLRKDFEITAFGARIAIVGSGQDAVISPRAMMVKEINCRGVVVMNSSNEERRQYAQRIEAGVFQKKIQPIIANAHSPQNASEAHREIMNSKHKGSIVIVF